MAQYALIEGYVEVLRSAVRWRRDVDDLVAELEDHLYSAVERFEAAGADRQLAQQRTLERFGDPDLLATAFASTKTGGIAVPTTFTRSAGLAALLSAGAWIATLLAGVASVVLPSSRPVGSDPDQFVANPQTIAYMVGAFIVLGAGALMIVAMVGLYRRSGSLGAAGMVGLGITALGTAATIFFWAPMLWMTLLGVGTLVFTAGLLRREVAPTIWTTLFGGGFALGAVTWTTLRLLQLGNADEWGDYPVADIAGVIVGMVVTAIGLAGIGRWLRGEEPANIEPAGCVAA